MRKFNYKDKVYCDEDLSEEIDNYGGNEYDLFWDMSKDRVVEEITYYYCPELDKHYDDIDTFLGDYFEEVKE